jgi:alpha-galactosidase/6-phospho-beta-glucosidase family protein
MYMEAAIENDAAKLRAALSTDPLVNDFRKINAVTEELLTYNNRFRKEMP